MLGNSARQCGGSTCEGRGSHRLTWSGMLENERSSAQLIFNKNNNNIKNAKAMAKIISMSITMSLLLFFLWYSALFTDEIYGVHPLNLELFHGFDGLSDGLTPTWNFLLELVMS